MTGPHRLHIWNNLKRMIIWLTNYWFNITKVQEVLHHLVQHGLVQQPEHLAHHRYEQRLNHPQLLEWSSPLRLADIIKKVSCKKGKAEWMSQCLVSVRLCQDNVREWVESEEKHRFSVQILIYLRLFCTCTKICKIHQILVY